MIRSNWDNRFLGMFVALIIIFVLVVSGVIFHENDLTAHASLPTSVSSTMPTQNNANPAMTTVYAPAQSPQTTRQMYVRMQQPVVVTKLSSAHSMDQNYNIGYEWASEYKISSTDQCKVLSAEYLSGCNAYIEVKNYINSTDPSGNAARH